MEKKLLFLVSIFAICVLFQYGNLFSMDNNISIYMTTDKFYYGKLVEINDSSVIIFYESKEKSGNLMIPRSFISRVFMDDEAIHDLGTTIEIYSKNYVKRNYQIKGIDFERNVLYIDRIYTNFDFDYVHKRDSIDLSDTNLIKIIIDPKTPWLYGLVKAPGYGFLFGAIPGVIVGGLASYCTDWFFTGMFLGGALSGGLGTAFGLTIGVIYIISQIDNDVVLKPRKNMKEKMLNYIYYPEIIRESDN